MTEGSESSIFKEKVSVSHLSNNQFQIEISEEIDPVIVEDNSKESIEKQIASRGINFLQEKFPQEFLFDFHLTMNEWKKFIIDERKKPLEIAGGLSKEQARWAWNIIEHWECCDDCDCLEYLDMIDNVYDDLQALGAYSNLSPEDIDQIALTIFKKPIKAKKPSSVMQRVIKN